MFKKKEKKRNLGNYSCSHYLSLLSFSGGCPDCTCWVLVIVPRTEETDLSSTAPNTQISGAVYIKGGSKSNTFEYTTAIYTTLFSLAITLYQQPAFHFFPTLLLFLSYSVSYLSNPRSTHLYSDPYSIPG